MDEVSSMSLGTTIWYRLLSDEKKNEKLKNVLLCISGNEVEFCQTYAPISGIHLNIILI